MMQGEAEFQVLGPLRVLIDDREMSLRSRHQQVLLAMLLVHRGHPLNADQLIDALWGEHPPASAATTLHTHLSRLRSRLGLSGLIARTGSGYSLEISFERLDSARFERLISEGRQARRSGDATAASRCLQEGLGLWRGAAFGALAEMEAVRSEAGRLEELKLSAVEERLDADLALGRHSQLIGELEESIGPSSSGPGRRLRPLWRICVLDRRRRPLGASLSAEEIKQAAERGKQLDPLDLTNVIGELRTRLTGSHLPTKSFTD